MANEIFHASRVDGGNAIVIGNTTNDTNLTVNGNLTLANETTAGFLINNTSGLVDSTTNGSTLTNVNAATVDNLNGADNDEPASFKLWSGTHTEYLGLSSRDVDTIYNVTDDASVGTATFNGAIVGNMGLTIADATQLNSTLNTVGNVQIGTSGVPANLTTTGTSTTTGVSTLTGGIKPNGTSTVSGIKFWAGTRAEFQAIVTAGTIDDNTIYNYPGKQIT